jgi:hypothetical protein
VTWPVALDNDYGTWKAYSNEYWPAEYLVDRRGEVREARFGEGHYPETEAAIRALLTENGTNVLRQLTTVRDGTPTEAMTPETYLGYAGLRNYVGSQIDPDSPVAYTFPQAIPQNALAYAGRWLVGPERIVAGDGARLRLHFHARDVYVVLGGKGRVESLVDGKPLGSLAVGSDRLYTVLADTKTRDGTLELRFSPGVEAYSFTFG